MLGLTATHPWTGSFPGHMPVPAMLSRTEIDYLHWLTSTQYTGRGRIVELGCFFGGSTFPLATGLAASPAADSPMAARMLTYDSFIMDADTVPRFPVGLGDGQSFRPIFESYLREHMHRISVREGWVPREFTHETARRIYPEQEPIEVLFIDIAKQWPVHNTILQTYGPHLLPGAILIQQDFKHHGCYWLGLHMLQLRDCFEPLHDVTGGASVAFRYNGGIEVELAAILSRDDIPDQSIAQSWHDVDAYWARQGRTTIRLIQRLAAATHLADAGRPDESIAFLELFEQEWQASRPSVARASGSSHAGTNRESSASEPPSDANLLRNDFLSALHRVARTTQHPAAAALLARHDTPPDTSRRDCLRSAAIARLAAAGHNTIALFGAGRHTAELLDSGWPFHRLTIAAILDDYSIAPAIRGIPVMRPAQVPSAVTAILVSSECSEDALHRAASAALPTLPIFRIYS